MMSWRHIVARPNSVALGVLAGIFVLILVYHDVVNPSPGGLAAVHAQDSGACRSELPGVPRVR